MPSALAPYKEVLHAKKSGPGGAQHHGQGQDKGEAKKALAQAQSKKEERVVRQQLKKVQPFCVEGDAATLALLLEELRFHGERAGDPYFETPGGLAICESEPHQDFYRLTLHFLAIWARESNLYIRGGPAEPKVRELYDFLKAKLSGRAEPTLTAQCWQIVLNGWGTVVSSLLEQGEMLSLILSSAQSQPTSSSEPGWYFKDVAIPGHSSVLEQFRRLWLPSFHFFYPRSPFSPSTLRFQNIQLSRAGGKQRVRLATGDEAKRAFRHAYFPPYPSTSALLLEDPKPLENGHLRRHNLQEIFRLYESQPAVVDLEESELEAELARLRAEHKSRVGVFWELMEREILLALQNCAEGEPGASQRTTQLWGVFGHLLEDAFGASDWIEPTSYVLLPRMMGFLQRCFDKLRLVLAPGVEAAFRKSPLSLPCWIRKFIQTIQYVGALLLLTFPTT